MRKTHRWLPLLTASVMLLIPVAASAADQTVELQVLPEDTLSIDVEGEIYLDAVVPGVSTQAYEFGMAITNTTTTGWAVTVSGTDLQGYNWNCDGDDCTRDLTGYTIPASAIYVSPGDQNNWGDDNAITPGGDVSGTTGEVNLASAATPYELMVGTSVASGSFGIDEQRPAVRVEVPGTVGDVSGDEYSNYYTTLTYTINVSS